MRINHNYQLNETEFSQDHGTVMFAALDAVVITMCNHPEVDYFPTGKIVGFFWFICYTLIRAQQFAYKNLQIFVY